VIIRLSKTGLDCRGRVTISFTVERAVRFR
jgi:hypothetical protein